MSGHREEFLELCAQYALGTLEDRDRKRLESHLSEGCAECEAALREYGYSSTLLAVSAPRVLPFPELRERVLAAVASEEPARGEARTPRRERGTVVPLPRGGRPGWFALAGWIAAIVLLITSGTFYESSGRLRAIIRAREADLNGAARDLAVERQWAGVLTSPIARVADLKPTPEWSRTGGIRGRAVYDPATRRAVVVLSSASAPDSVTYELWALRGFGLPGVPVSLGVIRPDAHGVAVLRLESVGEPTTLTAFAVTMEPRNATGAVSPHGGSPSVVPRGGSSSAVPRGPVVLMGTLREPSRAPARG